MEAEVQRYYLDEKWIPSKLDCKVPMPEKLSLEHLRGRGKQEGEAEFKEDADAAASPASAVAAQEPARESSRRRTRGVAASERSSGRRMRRGGATRSPYRGKRSERTPGVEQGARNSLVYVLHMAASARSDGSNWGTPRSRETWSR